MLRINALRENELNEHSVRTVRLRRYVGGASPLPASVLEPDPRQVATYVTAAALLHDARKSRGLSRFACEPSAPAKKLAARAEIQST